MGTLILENNYIENINLRKCLLSNDGMGNIATALLKNQSLKKVNLSNNTLNQVQSTIRIAWAISNNRMLEEIDLSYCKISQNLTQAIIRSCKKFSIAHKISLHGNLVDENQIQAMKSGLDHNRSQYEQAVSSQIRSSQMSQFVSIITKYLGFMNNANKEEQKQAPSKSLIC